MSLFKRLRNLLCRAEMPTDKQLNYAKALGIPTDATVTKKELSAAISAREELPTDKQLNYAKALGIPTDATVTKKELSAAISVEVESSPATKKQKKEAADLGIEIPEGVSRKSLDALINSHPSVVAEHKASEEAFDRAEATVERYQRDLTAGVAVVLFFRHGSRVTSKLCRVAGVEMIGEDASQENLVAYCEKPTRFIDDELEWEEEDDPISLANLIHYETIADEKLEWDMEVLKYYRALAKQRIAAVKEAFESSMR